MKNKKISIFTDIENIEEEAMKQFEEAMSLECNIEGALMPDVHAGYTLPIGAVVKTKEKVFPAYVGNDIGCGVASYKMWAVQGEISKEDLLYLRDYLLEKGVAKNRYENIDKWDNEDYYKNNIKSLQSFVDKGKTQLGTIGGGNHFLELGYDKDGFLWVTVHSGSRGFGGSIAKYYMTLAYIQEERSQRKLEELKEKFAKEFEEKNNWREHNPQGYEKAKEKYIQSKIDKYKNGMVKESNITGHYGFQKGNKEFEDYINDMNLAILFGEENRKKIAYTLKEGLEKILKRDIKVLRKVETNHNHAMVSNRYVIHRKGASYAPLGSLIAIPANMRDGVFIVRGKGNLDSLESTSHGAGRVLSRKKAKERLSYEKMKKEMENIVNNHDEGVIDESPDAYKDIKKVLEDQDGLMEVVLHIKPILNIKSII